MKTKAVPIRMSAKLNRKLVRAAKGAKVSLAEFMRKASEQAVDRKCRRCRGTGLER